MGILGAFLAVGWLGGNLVKDATKTAKVTPAMNAGLPDRIEWRNGNYYDTVTGKRVRRDFFNDPITGIKNTEMWVNAKTGSVIYVPSREKYASEQDKIKREIEEAKAENDAVWLQEAIDNNLRFAKVIIPYKEGVKEVKQGYFDRKQIVEREEDRKYYVTWSTPYFYNMIYTVTLKSGYWFHDHWLFDSYADEKFDKTIK